MSRVYRIVASVLATGLLSLGALAASIVPAEASTCSGFTCAGHDPAVYGCPVWSTTEADGTYAIVQNRYSLGCNSNWARGELTQAGLNAGYGIEVIIYTNSDSRNDFESMCWPSQDNNTGLLAEPCSNALYQSTQFAYTDMVDGTNLTTAIVKVIDPRTNKVIETPNTSQ